MRPRGCLKIFGAFIVLSIICCVLLWIFGIPRLQDNISDGVADSLSTEIAAQLPSPQAGTHTLDIAQIRAELEENFASDANLDGVELAVHEDGMIELKITSAEQEIGYEGFVSAENGELVISDMTVSTDWLGWFLPADKMADAIEKAVNSYFADAGLQIESVTAETDRLIFEVVEA